MPCLSRRSVIAAMSSLAIPTTGAKELDGEVGITTSSFTGHIGTQRGQFPLLDLPRVVRDELGMRIIDLNTTTLGPMEPAALDSFRNATEKAGRLLTNLKMNQRDIDMDASDPALRRKALIEYKKTIDAAARLGCRWARPLPRRDRPDPVLHAANYRELADYAATRNVRILVENFGWMESDPHAVAELVKRVGRNIAACPDTGNWSGNDIRYRGLAATFPIAASCDFKAKKFESDGRHPEYDLKRCFEIGWKTGFRGPWCLEILDPDRATLFRHLNLVRGWLQAWMKEGA